ncbi:MAG: GNAT family N-acetyltransferase [Synergistaceae bacterium]|nr:GNAT family N-acetyltransferase [Synergistaceae bacterium]
MNDTVISNLISLIEISGSLDNSRGLADRRGLWACDVNTESAYENYSLLTARGTDDIDGLVASGLDFFKSSGNPHIWPIFPETPPRVKFLLEAGGARYDDTFFGMTASLPYKAPAVGDDRLREIWLSCGDDTKPWADAVWYGFDSGEPAPENFARFVSEIALRGEIFIFGLTDPVSGVIAATGLLNLSGTAKETAGIYYVSTRPEFRRKEWGARVMRGLMEKALALGCRAACLIASPAGRPLYLKCGFEETARVEIMIYDYPIVS